MDKMSIKEIKNLITEDKYLTEDFLEGLAQDDRLGVQQIYKQIINRKRKIDLEQERTFRMYSYEREAQVLGYHCIVGIDEVGRGPLAGPVVAAAVVLPSNEMIVGLDDSKKLSPDKRVKLAEIIREKAVFYAYGCVEAPEIDKINIYQATLKAMQRAVETLKGNADYLLIDAMRIPALDVIQNPIIGGDGKSASIAAASILAKVYRDQLMENYHEKYPIYKFDQNKGYGTKDHMDAIIKHGFSPIHRHSFNVPGVKKVNT